MPFVTDFILLKMIIAPPLLMFMQLVIFYTRLSGILLCLIISTLSFLPMNTFRELFLFLLPDALRNVREEHGNSVQ